MLWVSQPTKYPTYGLVRLVHLTTLPPSPPPHPETNIHVVWTWYDTYCRNVQWVHIAHSKLTSILVLQKCKTPSFYSGDWAVEGYQSKSLSSCTLLQPAHFSLRLYNCDTGDRAKCLRQVLLQSSLSNQWAAESLSTANLSAHSWPRLAAMARSLSLPTEVQTNQTDEMFTHNKSRRRRKVTTHHKSFSHTKSGCVDCLVLSPSNKGEQAGCNRLLWLASHRGDGKYFFQSASTLFS